jgi:ethanolamine utilization protein EutA
MTMSADNPVPPGFAGRYRTLNADDEIALMSVGIDIGSSTSHLVFSRILMQRAGTRYVVADRSLLFESAMELTPYAAGTTIDADALGRFIDDQYAAAGLSQSDIDTGALILTGVAAERDNARAIGEALALGAGRLVGLSAGDALEATLVAHGSGAVELSRHTGACVMAVDVGGGTSKIAVCERGEVVDRTVVDAGARIVQFDAAGRLVAVENSARRIAKETDAELVEQDEITGQTLDDLANTIADRLFQAMGAMPAVAGLEAHLRLPPLRRAPTPDVVLFSGGVAEYLYARESRAFGDLGPRLARAIRERCVRLNVATEPPAHGIRATVLGASQYTVQLSGGTIFVSPDDVLPLRNIMALRPRFALGHDAVDPAQVADAIRMSLAALDATSPERPIALCFAWQGSASYARLDGLCAGIIDGMAHRLAAGAPLVLVTDTDVGGLIGMHCREERALTNPIVSIDGVELGELDFVDIGELVESSGAVPVVIKSLQFGALHELR